MAFETIIKILPRKEAIERVREILDLWEMKGYSKPNDVPPTDPHISEFLQLMKGFGYPVDYKYKEKLKEVI
jgi:cyanate lyase